MQIVVGQNTLNIQMTAVSGQSTFGFDSGAAVYLENANRVDAIRVQNTSGITVLTGLEIKFSQPSGNGKVHLYLFDDNNGLPGNLLIDAGEVNTGPSWAGIYSLNYPVTPGAFYQIAFELSAPNTIEYTTTTTPTHTANESIPYGTPPVGLTWLTPWNTPYVMRAIGNVVTPPPSTGMNIIGYINDNQVPPNNTELNKLTHLIYETIFVTSSTDPTLFDGHGDFSRMTTFRNNAKSANPNIKFLASLGGGNYQDQWDHGHLTAIMANQTYRAQLVTNLANLVSTYNLDGVDIDWEGTDVVGANYHAFLISLRAALPGKVITVVTDPVYITNQYSPWFNPITDPPLVDGFNITSYGLTYANFITYTSQWITAGFPVVKLFTGYSSLVDDISLIAPKVTWGMAQKLGGQFLWTVDTPASASFIDAIYNTVNGIQPPPSGGNFKLTIDNTKMLSGMVNFPVLIKLGASSGITAKDTRSIFTALGNNMLKLAVTLSDGITQCFAEISRWDAVNQLGEIWASIPNTSNPILNLNFNPAMADNTAYVGITGSVPALNVWDAFFEAVYHLAVQGTGAVAEFKDSTAHANHGSGKSRYYPAGYNESIGTPPALSVGPMGVAQLFGPGRNLIEFLNPSNNGFSRKTINSYMHMEWWMNITNVQVGVSNSALITKGHAAYADPSGINKCEYDLSLYWDSTGHDPTSYVYAQVGHQGGWVCHLAMANGGKFCQYLAVLYTLDGASVDWARNHFGCLVIDPLSGL